MKSFKEMRQDPHCPRLLEPADYTFVGAADAHPGTSYMEIDHSRLASLGVETGTSDRTSAVNVPFYDATQDGRPNWRCHHCGKHGSNIRYFCFFLHKPSKRVVVVGQICARKLALASREELDFQKHSKLFIQLETRHQWIADHEEEFAFLQKYAQRHRETGFVNEFLSSVWDQFQAKGQLTEKQTAGVRKWIVRQSETAIDGDRHKGVVTRTQDEPTEAQWDLIRTLCKQLGRQTIPTCFTRMEASDVINRLRAEQMRATDKQMWLINQLLEQKSMPLDKRRATREQMDQGLTKEQASRWIQRLNQLDDIPETS